MRKILSLLAVLLLFNAMAFAQNKTVTGKVRDDKGDPIPFATVAVKGTKTAVAADASGNFTINLKDGSTLVVSSTGFETKEINVGNQTSVTINMTGASRAIDEVIVTAGGIKTRRKEIGTANTVIKADVLTAGKAINVAGGLQGKVAGMQINATGGGVNPSFRVVLRGQRSLTGNNQALLVLDNVIVPNEILGNLNPDDIEDVVVLNGAGAAALYGSQASNGALIVTTKKGRRGVTTIGLQHTTTVESVAFFPKIQKKFGSGGSAYGFDVNGQPLFNYLENQSYGPAFDGIKRPLGPPLEDGSQDSAYYSYNDGHNDFWEKGITNQSDVSFSTGDDNSTFYMSAQYAGVTGTTPGDKYNRTSLRLNGTRRVGSMVNITYTAGYTQNRYNTTTQTGAMYGNMLNMPSNVDITKYKNWRTDPFANPIGYYNPWYQNPYFTADNYRNTTRNDYLTANIELKFTPLQGLDLIARQGISTRNASSKSTVGGFVFTDYSKHTDQSSKADIAASVADGSSYRTQLLTDAFAQYQRKLNDFSLNLIAGGQWTQNEAKNVNVSANGLVVPDLFTVGNGVGTPGATESNFKARQIGAYGDMRIGYKNFLFLHGTARNDWVSILAPENRSFFYPSVDLSFVATDAIESLKSSSVVSFLKLRAGWSKVGNVNLGGTFGAYQLLPTFSSTASGFPFGSLAGFTVDNTLVSNDLRPEITKGYEAGFDMNFLRDRITSNFTWFSTKTDDQTVTTRVSNTTGFSTLRTNTGQTESSGIELTLHGTPVRNNDWDVTIGGNYTYLDNNVNFISNDLPRLGLATYGADGPGSYAVAGHVFP
ncbi:MAG: SusC/RagA family TonB-linked outer membrane protein, partial [Flavisolibacter sp.]